MCHLRVVHRTTADERALHLYVIQVHKKKATELVVAYSLFVDLNYVQMKCPFIRSGPVDNSQMVLRELKYLIERLVLGISS